MTYQKLNASFGHASNTPSALYAIWFLQYLVYMKRHGTDFLAYAALIHFFRSTLSWYLDPPKVLCSVPIGQKEHQALGAIVTPKKMATEVVSMQIVTKTSPTLSTIPFVPMIRKIINPMTMKIGIPIHVLLKIDGILTFRLIGPSQKSTKLPRGQRLPQNHLPLKGAVTIGLAKTSSKKYMSFG